MMVETMLNPQDSLEVQNKKLLKIVDVLMQRAERAMNYDSGGYWHFQNALTMEARVRSRTRDLEQALYQLNRSNYELAHAKQEADEAHRTLTGVLEAVREGFALFDAQGCLISSNSRFAEMIADVAPKIIPGMTFMQYITLVAHSDYLLLDEDMPPKKWIQRRMTAHNTGQATFVVPLKNARWLQVSERQMEDGKTVLLQTNITDMVRLARGEQERLMDHKTRLVQTSMDYIHEAVMIFDKNATLVHWNEPLLELPFIHPDSIYLGCMLPSLLEEFKKLFPVPALETWVRTAKKRTLTHDVTTKNQRTYRLYCRRTPDDNIIISIQNTSDFNRNIQSAQAQQQALRQERVPDRLGQRKEAKVKATFLTAAGHDLLQPLHAARLFLDSLQSTSLTPDQTAISRKLGTAINSMSGIIESLTEISRLGSGMATPRLSHFVLSDIFVPLEQEFGILAKEKGITLKIAGGHCPVCSDSRYLRRIIQNIISNAIHYTDDENGKGKVLMVARIRPRERQVYIDIMDNGQGIPADKQEVVFHEFVRAVNTRKQDLRTSDAVSLKTPSNLGLGLSFVRAACTMLQYDLRLKSEENKGTWFRIKVPLGKKTRTLID